MCTHLGSFPPFVKRKGNPHWCRQNAAEPNTKANIETCGVLAGKLSQNKFQITHLIIPKQSGTADSCTTTGEEAIFDYQEKYSLITLGWVSSYLSLL